MSQRDHDLVRELLARDSVRPVKKKKAKKQKGKKMNIEQKIKDDIARAGHSVISVMSDGENLGFAYTVGLWETYNHPEIIVFGLPASAAHSIISNVVSDIIDGGKRVEVGARYSNLANLPLVFIAADPKGKAEYALLLDNHYGSASDDVPVVQMVWPDMDGRFPWEEGFDEAMRPAQPMMGDAA